MTERCLEMSDGVILNLKKIQDWFLESTNVEDCDDKGLVFFVYFRPCRLC